MIYELSKEFNSLEEAFVQVENNNVLLHYDKHEKFEPLLCDTIVYTFCNKEHQKEEYEIFKKYFKTKNNIFINNSIKNMLVITGLKPTTYIAAELVSELTTRKDSRYYLKERLI